MKTTVQFCNLSIKKKTFPKKKKFSLLIQDFPISHVEPCGISSSLRERFFFVPSRELHANDDATQKRVYIMIPIGCLDVQHEPQ